MTVNGIGERAGNAALEEVVMNLRTRHDVYGLDYGIKTEENIDGTTSASVTLGVQGRVHLAEVIKKVRIMPGIAKVSRQRQQ